MCSHGGRLGVDVHTGLFDLEKTGGADCSVLLFLDHLWKSQIVAETSTKSR